MTASSTGWGWRCLLSIAGKIKLLFCTLVRLLVLNAKNDLLFVNLKNLKMIYSIDCVINVNVDGDLF
jgi:hypothetical protein